MVPQPRWTIPVNMRSQDKPILDAAMSIARSEGSDITTVFRAALANFVRTRVRIEAGTMDQFLRESEMSSQVFNHVLTPVQLKNWSENSLLDSAKLVRSRKQELDSELRRRGYFFKW